MLIDNLRARHIFMDKHGLSRMGTGALDGAALAQMIDGIGFVQLDSINTLARAHDMILIARHAGYRPDALKSLFEGQRGLWEHWTHDASLIPMYAYPYWQDRFAVPPRNAPNRAEMDRILDHITQHGAACSRDVGTGQARGTTGWWDWTPSKAALEQLWRMGVLAVSGRVNFQKTYDLATRVIPAAVRDVTLDRSAIVDWAARMALARLGFATAREIAAYFALIDAGEAKAWLARADVRAVQITGADGSLRAAFALNTDLDAPAPDPILRLLSPFDPMLRDRARAEFLFGFHYRIEVFVPEPKRQYGYYVFPILQGDRLIGRIDVKAHRSEGALRVRALWPEAGVRFAAKRCAELEAELQRLVPFSGCDRLEYAPDWLREGGTA